MTRREFVALLGGGAMAVLPRAVHAQQALPVIGLLSTRSPDESAHLMAAFRRGLAESGLVEGQSVAIEFRWARGQYHLLPGFASELANRPVAVLVAAGGEPAAQAAKVVSSKVPVVASFGADPVASGYVRSLNRPDGNITGISNLTVATEPKRLGLLREVVPNVASVGALLNPNSPTAASQLKDIQDATRAIGLELHPLWAGTEPEIDAAFEIIARLKVPALTVSGDGYFNSQREKLTALAARHAVPTMYNFRDYATAGGLMSYGIDLADMYRQLGVYAGRIVKGAKPADLPVLLPSKFEFVINLKTAKMLGLKISDNVHSLADEVIE